jgi:septum formation protein
MPGRLILASKSPRRIELLAQFELPFDVIGSDAEELHDDLMDARALCSVNALRKAEVVSRRFPLNVVVGADTLVSLEDRHLAKPATLEEAADMLRALSGRTHQVTTGVALLQESRRQVFATVTQVTFRRLSEETIRRYLEWVPVLDKAGAYAIQERGEMLVQSVGGSLSNVIGLPVEDLAAALSDWGLITQPARDRIVAGQKRWDHGSAPRHLRP